MSKTATIKAKQGVLLALNHFAKPSHMHSAWQLVSTLGLLLGIFVAVRWLSVSPARFLLLLPLIGCLTRIFVLQHDCGHHSLFRNARWNDLAGTLFSFITGIAYEAWRHEHEWHHNNQSKLSRRGIDRVNSPMLVQEAISDPKGAKQRHSLIRVYTVFLLGIVSLLFKRKRLKGFFPFRPGFRWRCGDPKKLARSLYLTLFGHLMYHALFIAVVGVRDWALILLPAMLIGAGFGSLLFWVQHNFENSHHADDDAWHFADAGLKGSSYLRLPRILAWFSADIGIHHVHHCHPRVPNYRLEEARRAIPEFAAVSPLSWEDFGRCFTHVFWCPKRGRMVTFEEIISVEEPSKKPGFVSRRLEVLREQRGLRAGRNTDG